MPAAMKVYPKSFLSISMRPFEVRSDEKKRNISESKPGMKGCDDVQTEERVNGYREDNGHELRGTLQTAGESSLSFLNLKMR